MTLVWKIVLGLLLLVSAWNLLAVTLSALRVRRTRATRLGMGIGGPPWLIALNVLILVSAILSYVRDPDRYPAWGAAVALVIMAASLSSWLFGTWIDAEGLCFGALSAPWPAITSCRIIPRGDAGAATLQVEAGTIAHGPLSVRLRPRKATQARALLAKHGHGEGLPAG